MAIKTGGTVRISDAGQLQNVTFDDALVSANVASAAVDEIRAENHTIVVRNSAGTILKTFYCVPPA